MLRCVAVFLFFSIAMGWQANVVAQTTKLLAFEGPPLPPKARVRPTTRPTNLLTQFQGTLLDLKGKPVQEGKIQLQRSLFPEDSVSAVVKANGQFNLKTKKYGVFWLVASGSKAYKSNRRMLFLERTQTITVTVRLQRQKEKTKTKAIFQLSPSSVNDLEEARKYFQDCKKKSSQAMKKFQKTGKSFQHFHYNWKPVLATIRNHSKAAKSRLMRELWTLYQVSLPISFYQYSQMQALMKKRKAMVKQMIQRVSLSSPLWAVSPRLTHQAIKFNFGKEASQTLQEMLKQHPNPGLQLSLRATILFDKGFQLRQLRASHAGLLERARLYPKQKKNLLQQASSIPGRIKALKASVSSHFSHVQNVVKKYPSERLKKLQDRIKWTFTERFPNGSQVPSFRANLIDHKEKQFTPHHMGQRYTLVMFWATWCAPCVAKFPQIVKLSKSYPKKLQILAVSHDRDLKTWREFRKTKWNMPWYNVVLGKSPYSRMGRLFQVRLLPTMFLLSPKGKVIANGTTLRASGWLERIKRALGKPL